MTIFTVGYASSSLPLLTGLLALVALLKSQQAQKREEEGKLEKRESDEIPLPLSLPLYPVPLSTPATRATKKPRITRVIARYVFVIYVATLYMNCPRCGDFFHFQQVL